MIPVRKRQTSEDGYMLVAAMFLLFLLALSLAIAAPMVAKSIQRDREVETMERGKQYMRAIQLYYRKLGAYPPSIDALVKTNNIRFLRKRYIDPLTGKDDWKTIPFGQNKVPLAMGFFGQALAGGNSTGTTSGTQSSSILGGSSLFSSSSGASTTTNASDTTSSTGASTTGSSDTTGTTASSTGTSGTTTGAGTSTTGTSTSIFGSQSTSQTFGGAGIVGVSPPLNKQSILSYKKKNRYNEWEFTYSPLSDQMKQTGGNTGTIGKSASSLSSSFSSSGSTSSTTSSGSTATTGASGTTTTQTQQ